jgi:hypothetical protein
MKRKNIINRAKKRFLLFLCEIFIRILHLVIAKGGRFMLRDIQNEAGRARLVRPAGESAFLPLDITGSLCSRRTMEKIQKP